MEITDGLFLSPLVGETKPGDIPASVRMQCYEAMLRSYFPAQRVVLGVIDVAMRYAGPREAVFHALIRQNFGCTHFIVGRDHAGVGQFYGPFDAHRLFEEIGEREIGIQPLFFDGSFYCRRCLAIVTGRTCPHKETEHRRLSGTEVRELLARGEQPPEELMRPEVAEILLEAYRDGTWQTPQGGRPALERGTLR
jgi:sulfate adenylyltransferase